MHPFTQHFRWVKGCVLRVLFNAPITELIEQFSITPAPIQKEPIMEYSSADFHSKHTTILEEIDKAAYEIINDRPEGIIPTAMPIHARDARRYTV